MCVSVYVNVCSFLSMINTNIPVYPRWMEGVGNHSRGRLRPARAGAAAAQIQALISSRLVKSTKVRIVSEQDTHHRFAHETQ